MIPADVTFRSVDHANAKVPPGARRDTFRLGWPYRIAAVCTVLLVAVLWFGVQLCGLGENRSELYQERCGSGFIHTFPLFGFVVLGVGIASAKRTQQYWLAWVVLTLALVPGLIAWKLLSV